MSKIEIPSHVYGAVESELRGRRLRRRTLGGVAMSGAVFAVVFGVTALRPQPVLALEQVVMKPRPGQVMTVDYTRKMGPVKGTWTSSHSTDGKVHRWKMLTNGKLSSQSELRECKLTTEEIGLYVERWSQATTPETLVVPDLERFKLDAWRRKNRTRSVYQGQPVIQFSGSRTYRDGGKNWVLDSVILADAKTGNVIRVEDWRDNRSYYDVYEIRFTSRDSSWDAPLAMDSKPAYDIEERRNSLRAINLNIPFGSVTIRAAMIDEIGQYTVLFSGVRAVGELELTVGDEKLYYQSPVSKRSSHAWAFWWPETPPRLVERRPLGLTIKDKATGEKVVLTTEQLFPVSNVRSINGATQP